MLEQKENTLITQFAELKNIAETTEKSFGNMVKAEEVRQLKSFKRMKKRLLHAEKIKKRIDGKTGKSVFRCKSF
jgi:hypothetical protein